MKKHLYIICLLLLGFAVSCTEKELTIDPQDGPETVTFNMKVTVPEVVVQTKADADVNPIIENIYVATFGNNRYLNEYVKALPVNKYADENGTTFEMKVTLLATKSRRHVHVIANGPESMDYNTRDVDLLEHLTTKYSDNKPQGAYWAYFYLPNGTADWNSTTNEWEPGETGDEGTSATEKFENITLVRNFARVKVKSSAPNFRINGFYVFRTESEGSITMPKGSTFQGGNNFIDTKEYAGISATAPISGIYGLGYNGYTPSGVELRDVTASTSVTYYTSEQYQFVYESVRDAESNEEPFIIIKGQLGHKQNNGTYQWDNELYYRIELTDEDGTSYPLFRNLDYTIDITAVAPEIIGESNPVNARTCNGNVSTTVDAVLPELSDGFSALYVLYTDRTYTNPSTGLKPVQFKYKYVPDLNTGAAGGPCSLEIVKSEGSGHAISGTDGSWYQQSGPDSDGWYTVTYNLFRSSSIGSEATTLFKVKGTTTINGKESSLYRNVYVRLLPTQEFSSVSVTGEGKDAGDAVDISLTLPDNLPESMFPIAISVQDSQLALNPVGTDMECITHSDGLSFHFVKNITWDEYNAGADHTVECNMKLIQDVTGSLTIEISNEDFITATKTY